MATRAYDDLRAGTSLGEIVAELDRERQQRVEERGSAYVSEQMGTPVRVRFTKIGRGARRTSKMASRWLAFDPAIDVEVTIGEETQHLEGVIDRVIPEVAQGVETERAPFLTALAPMAAEVAVAVDTMGLLA